MKHYSTIDLMLLIVAVWCILISLVMLAMGKGSFINTLQLLIGTFLFIFIPLSNGKSYS